MSIRVALADDHTLIRQGLFAMLDKENDITVVAQAGNGREAVRLVVELNPDVVILDIDMPDLNGIDAAERISKNTGTKIIALSIHTTRRFVTGMLKAGARAYLVKQCAYEELANAVRAVAQNRSYLSPQIHDVLVNHYTANLSKDEESLLSILTLREREVIQHVAQVEKSEEIADLLVVTLKTVSSHRAQIMKKLNVNSVAELTRLAISEGVISAEC